MEVLELYHRGIPCLLPARQIVAIDVEAATSEEVHLWPGLPVGDGLERVVLLETPAGRRCIRGESLRLRALSTGAAQVLPALLREALGLPHVVGIAEEEGVIRWLVDLERLDLG